ncbi:MAG TPA: (2Fe-2S)-binding protein [Holophagaceae bacterium]|nr:(2Fe-2S)-binding protein [Holophagaceae bacterium]
MAVFNLSVNGRSRAVDAPPDMPLLWVLRDLLGMTGTKYGCGLGVCGSCTLHVGGEPFRACQLPVSEVGGRPITTIEGLSEHGDHPVQKAWIACDVAQCGYCQSGQIMQAAWLLSKHPHPTDAQIDEQMQENLCRCGTYQRIREAVKQAAGKEA